MSGQLSEKSNFSAAQPGKIDSIQPQKMRTMPTIDPAELTAAIRRSQNGSDFQILDWSAGVLSDKGGMNGGLFLYSGHGRDGQGVRPWSIVLKIVKAPEQPAAQDDWWYWKRDLLVYQSGLLDHLPGAVVAPQCYSAVPDDGDASTQDEAHIWMEYIVDETPGQWRLGQFEFAARQLGLFHAPYLTGTPLPAYPWLSTGVLAGWLKMWNPESGWDCPVVMRHMPGPVRERIIRTWDKRDRLLAVMDRLPQTFSHLDFKRRNLMIRNRADGQAELVAIDWEVCGNAPVGVDVAYLVGHSCLFFDWEPADLATLERAVMHAYLTSLRAAGWHGDARLAWLGYLGWIGLQFGVIMSSAIATFAKDEDRERTLQFVGRAGDDLAAGWTALGEFALGRAEGALRMMDELGMR
jgi:hypothetical protein